MTRYVVNVEMPDGKLNEIMERLYKAQEEIRKCYDELCWLGVLTIREGASGN
ncbi:MAG: hypothetical protein LIO54_03485 [Oscillospiraceae bacterium]|nr:hypothetical protein [Oscillospiraceae bacterium]